MGEFNRLEEFVKKTRDKPSRAANLEGSEDANDMRSQINLQGEKQNPGGVRSESAEVGERRELGPEIWGARRLY